ncbi:hypothetical protein SKA34_00847 [Photobacterium sp. SKA34]|nr:hypothetical protein SKA34_00847 [Photobacterium sp. SKA34]
MTTKLIECFFIFMWKIDKKKPTRKFSKWAGELSNASNITLQVLTLKMTYA